MLGRTPGLPDEPFWTVGKIVSGAICSIYVIVSLLILGPADAFETALSCALPILMIWAPEIMGDYTGLGVIQGRPLSRPSPAGLVWLFGWIVLLLPPVLILIALR